MEISQENTKTQAQLEAEGIAETPRKVDMDHFDIRRFSRWTDLQGRLMVLISIYHGLDPTKPYLGSFQRVGVDLLLVNEEKVEYMDIGRFVYFVINSKLVPWKETEITDVH